jgi:hypothetical protein
MMVEWRIEKMKIIDWIKENLLLLWISSPLFLNEWRLFWYVFAYAPFMKVAPL